MFKVAGPFLGADDKPNGSLLILDCASEADARALLAKDPYAKAGLFASVELKPWRQAVSAAALEARSQQGINAVLEGPCTLSVVFRFPRPKGHYGKQGLRPSAPIWKVTKPDLDKCLRAAADALSHVLIRDDSQIVSISAAKRWAAEDETPGCTITLIPHLDVQAPRC